MRKVRFLPASGAVSLTFTTDLAAVRALVRRCAQEAGLSDKRTIDLVIAVGEIAANTVQHAKTAGTLDIWSDAGEIICQITDEGVIDDPLAGSRAPEPGATTGYGLWMVNQVCDRVDLHSDETGTVIRMHMNLKDLAPVTSQRRQAPPREQTQLLDLGYLFDPGHAGTWMLSAYRRTIMKYGPGLLLIGVGAILAFAVTTNTSVFNLHTAGYVLMLIGVLALVLPRTATGLVGRRVFVRRYERLRGRVENVTYPPYVNRNRANTDTKVLNELPAGHDNPVPEGTPGETEVIEDVYEE
ncbi:MAG TPA: DUF6458 family protein [Streptosporangiaceae bacterium]